MTVEIVTLPVIWIRAELYCQSTGENMDMVKDRIYKNEWAAGIHYKRIAQRILMINLPEVSKWMDKHPHVEAAFLTKSKSRQALKSGKASAA